MTTPITTTTPPATAIATATKQLETMLRGSSMENMAIQRGIIPPRPGPYDTALEDMIAASPTTIIAKTQAIKLAQRQEPVLVLGETGTGKELIAKILHGRRQGSFVAVNTTAVTETLFESELFGHVKGSFTGASCDRPGLIEHARGGTLFLDEIGDMPPTLQAKLLRVIDTGLYRRVGDNVEYKVECRIVSATHRDLRQGTSFRLDLYQRLSVFILRLLSLHERAQDCVEICKRWQVTDDFAAALASHTSNAEALSGNIRQLHNLWLRWSTLGADSITREDWI